MAINGSDNGYGRDGNRDDPNFGGQTQDNGQFDGGQSGNDQYYEGQFGTFVQAPEPAPFDPNAGYSTYEQNAQPAPFDQNQAPAAFDQNADRAPFTPEPYVEPLPEPEPATDYGFDRPAELELGDDDVRLPWLEGDDEDEFEERRSGMGQGLVLVVLGLVAIAAIIGGLMWAMRDKPDGQLVADGGLIEAPKEPYKTKPENPGGEVVDGTGDTSFAVAEGQTRSFKIDGKDETPKPGFDSVGKPASAAPASAAAAPALAAGGVGVQVGAYSSKDAAEAGWNALKSQYPDLSGISHRVLQGQADIGTVYRLQAVPGDKAAARALCNGMKGAGLSCQVKD